MTSDQPPRVELVGISKAFAGVPALDRVDFTLHPGEVHALLGENGAGKSTLIKIMTGALAADAGEMRLDGRAVAVGSTAEARALGISTVYQEVNLVPTLSVARNVTLGREPRRFGLISWRAAREKARARLKRLSLEIDVERALGSFPVAVQQLVAIARALEEDSRVLVLDEPTASLDAQETRLLFRILRDLKAQGMAVVFISHFLDQVYEISDRISVLRNGRLVGSAATAALPQRELITLMLGRELERVEQRAAAAPKAAGAPVLAAEKLGRRRWIEPFDLVLRAGEAIGLAGLLGSGRTETAKLIFGAVRADSGRLTLDGAPLGHASPRRALRRGIAFCPEDRKAEGLVLDLSVRENILLALQTKRGWLRPLPRDEQRRLAEAMIEALGIATSDAEKPVGQLSGGNQQKVVLARALASKPRVLVLDEPTRGIDVGAHAEIVALVRRLCAEGLALLVASSELDEIVAVSDRVAVLRDRRIVGEIAGAEITRETIIELIAGG
ncbi:simple sugar transport system ATP-binding protein [Tistlia consotensis]|uniref:Monosaccharide ABC transporter ATP-binding protein, CUT2 family n=1 Tax=Tistlia consotensis USBA 355 TaxID=560819 RepID=A0A1Y6CCG0_9PROT|nr:sugar ABC transporter ATP-binding protein [Tistlia consotensis]SMF56540.1 monosaccharide ABC transporter ATP-binding protein, CUT2 family [Tistlia consotensis USBA 355]SNR44714.1 simple sugar transport system ATP-binding protein [Tistlia consotensis]